MPWFVELEVVAVSTGISISTGPARFMAFHNIGANSSGDLMAQPSAPRASAYFHSVDGREVAARGAAELHTFLEETT
jgi:hypothetical protein